MFIPLGYHSQLQTCFICKQDVLHHITESIVPYRVQRIVRKVIVTSKMEPVWAVFQGILDQDVKKVNALWIVNYICI